MNTLVESYSAALIVIAAGLVAFAVAQLLGRMLAISDFLLDRPNARSSHAVVTPRSGGLAIFGGWIAGMAAITLFTEGAPFAKEALLLSPLVGAAFLFGLADDRFNLSASLKFFVQIALSLLFVAEFGPLRSAPIPFLGDVALGAWGAPLTVLWVVGFMNAYNFMDGLNGIAAGCGALALAALSAAAAYGGSLFWAIALGLGAVSLLSFLPLNFGRARLFMGDNGSQAVGLLIAAGAIGVVNDGNGTISAYFGPLVMLPFLFDVAFTLAHRARRGRNILTPHREHLYQLISRLGLSHAGVTAVFLSLTALSTAVAILSLRLPPRLQFLAPLILAAAFVGPAMRVFRRAVGAGLLDRSAAEAEAAADAPTSPAAHAQAAE